MISAAPVIIRAVEPTPNATASVVSSGLGVALADPAEQEDVVVHREAEQDAEEEERHPGLDRRRPAGSRTARCRSPFWKTSTAGRRPRRPRAGSSRSPSRRRRASGTRPSAGRSSGRARRRRRSAASVWMSVEVVDVLGGLAGHEHLGVDSRERRRHVDRRAARCTAVDRARRLSCRRRRSASITRESLAADGARRDGARKAGFAASSRRSRSIAARTGGRARRRRRRRPAPVSTVPTPELAARARGSPASTAKPVGQRAARPRARCRGRAPGARARAARPTPSDQADDRPPHHRPDDRAPRSGPRCRPALRPKHGMRQRVDAVAEQAAARAGSSVSAASTATMPTRIAPSAEAAHDRVGHEQHPEQRDHERHAAEEHRAARRGAGRAIASSLSRPARALLAVAREDEQRVVDPEREAHSREHVHDEDRELERLADERRQTRARRRSRRSPAAAARGRATTAPKTSSRMISAAGRPKKSSPFCRSSSDSWMMSWSASTRR